MTFPIWAARRRSGGVTPMTAITAVTTGAGQTLTLQQLTPTGGSCTVFWGDGATSTISDGNTGTTTHEYAAAGTYAVTITNPHLLTVIDLRDSKILLNTAKIGAIIPSKLTSLRLQTLAAASVINSSVFSGAVLSTDLYININQTGTYTFDSAHFSGSTLSTNLFIYFSSTGTYTFDSAHFSGSTPSENMYLFLNRAGTYTLDSAHFSGSTPSTNLLFYFTVDGTYTFDSAHFSGSTPTDSLYLLFSRAGTYTFDSAHFSGSTLSTQLNVRFPQAGTYAFDSDDLAGSTPSSTLYVDLPQAGTYVFDSSDFSTAQPSTSVYFVFHDSCTTTIAQIDWTGIVRKITNPTVQMGLSDAEVDLVLLGIYDDFANRTATNGTLNVAGNNAAPTGTLQAQCAPTTGKEAAYELVNDSCGVSSNHYAAVTITA